MENITAIIASLLAVIALLIVVIRWILDSRQKTNGAVSQSSACALDHQRISAALEALNKALASQEQDHRDMFTKLNNIEKDLVAIETGRKAP